MKPFELTFRFDDNDNSLTRFNGLSIADLAKFLKALNKSVGDDGGELVLSEIKGNCYAPVISTPSKTQFERIKTLHTEIAKKNTNGFNSGERAYYKVLKELTGKQLILSVYTQDKSYFKAIEELTDIDIFPYFYQSNAYRGFLTRIGSRNLTSKNSIFISSYTYEVEIDEHQDKVLRDYYKETKIEFYITEKINKETSAVEHAKLDSFEALGEKMTGIFSNSIEMVREKHGDYFNEYLNNKEDE